MENCLFQKTVEDHALGCESFSSKNTTDNENNLAESTSYNLGNGLYGQKREKAIRSFLKREFPSVIYGQNRAIWFPDCFIAQRPDFVDVDLKLNEPTIRDWQK